jgi:hypothetical protein
MAYYSLKQVNHKWFLLDPGGNPAFLRDANHYGDSS